MLQVHENTLDSSIILLQKSDSSGFLFFNEYSYIKKIHFFIVSELYSITICSLEFVKSWKSHGNTWLELLLCFPTQNVPIPNNYYFGLWEINQKIPLRGQDWGNFAGKKIYQVKYTEHCFFDNLKKLIFVVHVYIGWLIQLFCDTYLIKFSRLL